MLDDQTVRITADEEGVAKRGAVERFATQGLLNRRLSALSEIPSLCVESGWGTFFRDFREYMSLENRLGLATLVAVPPNPSDFLAFPCAADELRLALAMSGSGDGRRRDLEGLAGRYGLSTTILNQPIRTLSGGERALIALAKAEALEPHYEGVVLASPVTWLHASRRHLVTELCDIYKSRGKSCTILLLDGEWPEVDGSFRTYDRPADLGRVEWQLRLNGMAVTFPESSFPNKTAERSISYSHIGSNLELVSPTLIQGENGVGKSSLAMVLANVLVPASGEPEILTSGSQGSARLLLQDSISQMFGMSSADHVHSTYRYDQQRRKAADSVLDEMNGEIRRALAHFKVAIATLDESGRPSSLLHDKLALAVERLIARTNLLILDEPSWGLSDILSREFMLLVIQQAHKIGIPVAVISHESRWLEHLFNSRLILTQREGVVEVQADVL